MNSKDERKYFLISSTACFLCALISIGYFIIKSRGFFLVTHDFDYQQIPFTIALHNALKEGGVGGWTWNYDLGVSTIQGFSFYELGSLFFWITMPFPRNSFPYLVGFVYILKYTAAGAISYLYLKRFVKHPKNAVIGAVLYAFSGFQATSLEFYHFHDVVAFFPLLLVGVERIREEPKDRIPFVFAVCINCLTNYYFFVEETVFLILYFCFRFFDRKKAGEFIKCAGNCLLCGVWGCAMAAVLFLPNIIYILNNPRTDLSALRVDNIFWDLKHFLFLLKGFLFPGEAMNNQSSIIWKNWDSFACYLPMFSLSLTFAFLLKDRNWLSRLLIVLFLCSFSPILSAGFLLFTETNMRWWFMFTMMMALASVLVLDQPETYPIKKGTLINICLLLLFVGFVVVASLTGKTSLLFSKKLFVSYFSVGLIGLLITMWLARNGRLKYETAMVPVCIMAILTTAIPLHAYRSITDHDADREALEVGMQLETIDPQYRYLSGDNRFMLPGKATGTSVFSSTRSGGSIEFDELFDTFTGYRSLDKDIFPGLAELFGGKYRIVTGVPEEGKIVQVITVRGNTFSVLERDACPIGYAVDSYILYEDLKSLPKKERGVSLLQAVVLTEEQAALLNTDISRCRTDQLLDETQIASLTEKNTANAVTAFSRDTSGFSCQTDYAEKRLVYFSVPCDQGWTACIDGEKTDITSSGGMILIEVPGGTHEISFRYRTPGCLLGLTISTISVAMFVIYAFLLKNRKKNGIDTKNEQW